MFQAKADGFVPGGASLHSCMTPHGPDTKTYEVGFVHIIFLGFSLRTQNPLLFLVILSANSWLTGLSKC